MPGTEIRGSRGAEQSISLATGLLIMIIVIAIVFWIFTGGKMSLLGTAGKLEGLFDPNKFTMCVPEKNDEGSCIAGGVKPSADSIAITCNNMFTGDYNVRLDNIKFLYENAGENRLGDRFEFLVVLDYANRLVLGRKPDNSFVISCSKTEGESSGLYECDTFGSGKPLSFHVTGAKGRSMLLHLTAWLYTPSLQATLESDTLPTFADMLDEFYPYYMRSIDLPVNSVDLTKACEDTPIPAISVDHEPKSLVAVGSSTFVTITASTQGGYNNIFIAVRPVSADGSLGPIVTTQCLAPERKMICSLSASLSNAYVKYRYYGELTDKNDPKKVLDRDEKELEILVVGADQTGGRR